MPNKPTYEELEIEIKKLDRATVELERVKEIIKEKEEFNTNLLHNCPHPIIVINPDTSVRYVNPALEELTGYSSEELLGTKAPYLWWTKTTLKKTHGDFCEALLIGARSVEELFVKKNGELFWVEITSTPIRVNEKIKYYLANWVDITERKQAEKVSQRSEALLKATQQLTKIGGWEWNAESQTITWTEETYRIHDFSPDQLQPGSTEHIKKSLECYDPKDQSVILDAFRQCINKGRAYDLEFPFTTAMGRRIWIRTKAEPVMDGDRTIKIIGNIMDITERKQAFEAFKEQKEFSEKIIETSSAIIVGLDKNHRIRIFNRGAEKITRFKSKEVIGSDWFEIFFEPEIYDEMDKIWKDAWGTNFHSYVNPIRAKNGAKRIISWQTTGMYESADESKHILISIGEDITERKQAEDALRESKEKYSSLVEATSDWIWEIDADGVYTYTNSKIRDLLGYEPEEIIGKTPFDLMPKIEADRLSNIFKKIVESQRPIEQLENTNIHKDGHLVILETSGVPIVKNDGALLGYRGIDRDISERKRTEVALRESEEKYRSMMEAMVDQMYICTSDFRVSYMNPAMIKSTGYDATGELCYKTLYAFDEQCPWCVHKKILQGKSVETEIDSPKDGRSFQTSNAPIFHQNGSISKITIYRDITDRKLNQNALIESERLLKIKAKNLEELNAALKVLLNKRQEDKEEFEERILSNLRTLIEPYIAKLKRSKLPQNQKTLLDILKSNLNEIVSPFTRKLSSQYLDLTPTQIQVANLVKQGKTNKDISEILHVAGRTIAFHRENIRKKLGLTNKKTNLETYLMSIN